MKAPLRGAWPATGRWRVQRYLAERAGLDGRSTWRWAVIGPAGEHVGSVTVGQWRTAYLAAYRLARHPEDRWW